ncbi:Branched-chain amino acid aminotransferase [Taphrina deformans PYCC 5710]|uniref:Branched-chain amino acid aminotransferase n=1 Tax=Taphrina deformans (strain PYCC 5710 / ATCC 11124 / CBS 356.35 / IMI 108563 / JCM 9778 / NBRC 8474) TaxID=1097556 RepID=R4XBX6_TAPDE|nr:Branched-chain amino acid aminotransferase [Taphrina deformans PYCC 5710]|eukprot:CCG80845.1 Branched-chain amino acid aminotransferase [Taphrina deformans PYCC 5710]
MAPTGEDGSVTTKILPPSDKVDWPNLAFKANPVNGHVQTVYKNGAWGELEFVEEPFLRVSVMAPALNYGQQCFEGLKAFRCKDGHIRIFRPDENAKRMRHSGEMVAMPAVPEDLFIEAAKLATAKNIEFVPPYELGQALYLRPLLLGTGPQLALLPPDEFTFIVACTPVANLYSASGAKPIDAIIVEDFDRAAPAGTGSAKLGGNYAPVFQHAAKAKAAGFPITLHLDSKTRSHVDEFSTSNFLALKGSGSETTLVVPESTSILKSVTTKSVIELAKSFGWKVERRPVPVEEISEFSEIMSAGTAAVISPIKSVTYRGQKLVQLSEECGPGSQKILRTLRAIQTGDAEDTFGWNVLVM